MASLLIGELPATKVMEGLASQFQAEQADNKLAVTWSTLKAKTPR